MVKNIASNRWSWHNYWDWSNR